LFKKGLVSRRREGRAFVYTAAQSREAVAATFTTGVLQDLLPSNSAAAAPFLSNLVDAMSVEDGDLLDELERLVRDKRQKMRKESR
jgi:predicted transcriptional regulator